FLEAMSMIGVTPASAYCGAQLVEAVGIEAGLAAREFPGVPVHFGGVGAAELDGEWLGFHRAAFGSGEPLPEVGEYKYKKGGRPHFHSPDAVKALQAVPGWGRPRRRRAEAEIDAAYERFAELVARREPVLPLDLLRLAE